MTLPAESIAMAAHPRLQRPALTSLPVSLPLNGPGAGVSAMLRLTALLGSDLAALFLSAEVAYFIWADAVLGQPFALYARIFPVLLLSPLLFGFFGLYPGFGQGAPELIRRLIHATSVAYLLLAGATFMVKLPQEYSRLTFVIAWSLSLVMVPGVRFATLTVVRRFAWWGEPTVVIGNPVQIELTLDLLRDARSLGYRVVGVLCSDRSYRGADIAGVPVLGGHELAAAVGAAGVSTAIVWGGSQSGNRGRNGTLDRPDRIGRLQRQFRHVVIVRGHDGLPVEHVQVRNLGTVIGIEFSNQLLLQGNRAIKRTLDLALGSIFLLISAPIIAICGLIVKFASAGPMFFCQEREGLHGRKIRMWKLRTMYVDAEERLKECLAANPELKREWESTLKLSRDPRVICGIGAFLRRFSIDELPQLVCVLAGTMSLVGPRPLPDYHLENLARDFRALRRTVRPGLTGMWQVMIRNSGGLREHERYDSYYARNWSVWLDLYVMAKTIFAVLGAKGAF